MRVMQMRAIIRKQNAKAVLMHECSNDRWVGYGEGGW